MFRGRCLDTAIPLVGETFPLFQVKLGNVIGEVVLVKTSVINGYDAEHVTVTAHYSWPQRVAGPSVRVIPEIPIKDIRAVVRDLESDHRLRVVKVGVLVEEIVVIEQSFIKPVLPIEGMVGRPLFNGKVSADAT